MVQATEQGFFGLRRIGAAKPIAAAALDAVEAREGSRLPPSYRALLEGWGVGQLCGFAWVLDPTRPDSSWAFWRSHLKKDALMFRREYKQWRAIDDATWMRLVVWADLDGKAL